ncbi:glycosyltransferase [Maribacter chungangensis]|uniref:Glycosyltransferase n=1 Tax=Maribacter chungangensis TaxID=1069117 RepID=A0ABW3B4Q0_9FLAO
MKIAHVISSIDTAGGGPSRSVTHLLRNMGGNFSSLSLALYTGKTQNPILFQFIASNINLRFYEFKKLGKLDGLEKQLAEDNLDLLHGHAIWDLPVHQMAKMARRLKVPYIITPRGMLEPWSLQQKRVKKQLALKLYQFKDLRLAACLHATAQMEVDSIRALGLKNPIALIPNGVPVEDFVVKDFESERVTKKILFLSRIHPKKGIENLITAWSQLSPALVQGWSVDIIGNGASAYIENLKKNIAEQGLSEIMKIKAPLDGKDKVLAYQEATFFVLPTHSENFGIVVAEALACGTPVITTKGAPWQDLQSYECGLWINIGVEALKTALEEAIQMPSQHIMQMGVNGRKLIEEKYSMEAVARKMHSLYEWILLKNDRPDFVRLD